MFLEIPAFINLFVVYTKIRPMKSILKFSVLNFFLLLLLSVSCNNSGNKAAKTDSSSPVSRVEVSIGGMTCTGCEQTIQANVSKLEGVKAVKATFTDGRALVDFDPAVTDTAMIRTAIIKSGYKVSGFSSLEPSVSDK